MNFRIFAQLGLVVGAVGLIVASAVISDRGDPRSEEFIMARSVKLYREDVGMCSGVQVRAPSGADYVLTAGHCAHLALNGMMKASTEDGRQIMLQVLGEDPNSDLLMLEGIPNMRGLYIADRLDRFEHVRTFTHGSNMDTYKTEGSVVQVEVNVKMPIFQVNSPGDSKRCLSPKTKILDILSFFGSVHLCIVDVMETVTTAQVVPGSSGGMMVNDMGRLVGIVSASNPSAPVFGFFVKLSDVISFTNQF